MDRAKILKELEKFIFVPGHCPNYDNMTDEQLELRLKLLKDLSDAADEVLNNKEG